MFGNAERKSGGLLLQRRVITYNRIENCLRNQIEFEVDSSKGVEPCRPQQEGG